MQTRREFLSSAAAAAALTQKSNAAPDEAAGEWRNKQPGMAYRKLGRTGFYVSEIVMGGNTIAPDNYKHVLAALDRGLNYLDTAPGYGGGKSEEGYAQVLKERPRDQFFLNTKISIWDTNRAQIYRSIFDGLPGAEQDRLRSKTQDEIDESKVARPDYFVGYFEAQRQELEDATLANVMEKEFGRQINRATNYKDIIIKSLDQSLKRLGTDHVDLMTCPDGANTPYEVKSYPEIFEAFEILKKAGKVRHLSVSAHTDPAGVINAAIGTGMYSACMVAYNVVNAGFVENAIARASKSDVGVIAMKVARPVFPGPGGGEPNSAGLKRLEAETPGPLSVPKKAYLWALKNPNVTAVISDMVNQKLVDENLPLAAPKQQ
jgi:aryl-alcohol dehydrogenase-like predicted oxidoreductase